MKMESAKEKLANDQLIVALDVDSQSRALELFEQLREHVGMFKVGMQLFTAAGPDIVRRIVARGNRVFLDLKYHDIPNTVALAAIEATRLGVSIFNIHASGGREMMKRTAEAVGEISARESLTKPKVIAVTLLTSVDHETLKGIGIDEAPETVVTRLASIAEACGLDGVVASAQEVRNIRGATSRSDFIIVTPGMRDAAGADDQRRTMTIAEAIRAGADYLVVGRPILNAADPVAAAIAIAGEIEASARHS
jgi:orotidine-5'-phosphate decarboxylase